MKEMNSDYLQFIKNKKFFIFLFFIIVFVTIIILCLLYVFDKTEKGTIVEENKIPEKAIFNIPSEKEDALLDENFDNNFAKDISAETDFMENDPIFNFVSNHDYDSIKAPGKGFILMAIKNGQQNPSPDYRSNPVQEYFIVSYNPETGETDRLALVKANIDEYSHFFLSDNKIFFLTSSGEIASLDIFSKTQSLVAIPGITPCKQNFCTSAINDFLVADNKIFYLKDGCRFDDKFCVIGVFDIKNNKNKILDNELQDKVDNFLYSHVELNNYEKNDGLITIKNIGGDAGTVILDLYKLNIDDGIISKSDSAIFTSGCEEYGIIGDYNDVCNLEMQRNNQNFNRLNNEGKINCGNVSIINLNGELILYRDFVEYFGNALYAGCIN